MKSPKVLFILKQRENYQDFQDSSYSSGAGVSSGLSNSANFVCEMLNKAGIDSKLVQVPDNNSIDKEVSLYKPTHVIIEAFWVVPEKFDILQKLHPSVIWVIRGHSEIPFLANEGIAMGWIKDYILNDNVIVATNSERSMLDLHTIIYSEFHNKYPYASKSLIDYEVHKKLAYLPNYYPVYSQDETEWQKAQHRHLKDTIDIACLGAIRPLKNQLIQAVSAIEFANQKRIDLNFHVNATRKEQGGDSNLKNLENLFKRSRHTLIKHDWMPHRELLHFLATQIDVSMNVSFSETFNIVAADSVSQHVPMVCSPEVRWASRFCQASPTSSADIVKKLYNVTDWHTQLVIKKLNLRGLERFSHEAVKTWVDWLEFSLAHKPLVK